MNFCNEAKITVMYSQIRNNYFALILSEKDQGIMMDRTLDRKKNVVLLHFLQCYHLLLQKDKLSYQDMHGSGAIRTYQVIFPVHHALLPPLDVYFMPEMKCLRSGGTFPSHHQVINSNIAQLP